MTEMSDRVGSAIAAAMLDGTGWHGWGVVGRKAIEAMMAPTIDMVVAGTEQWLCEAAMEDRAEANYRAMLMAALQETDR